MQKTSFVKRFIVPVAIVLVIMIATLLIYHRLSWNIDNRILQGAVAHVSAVILFTSIGFGTFLIYPIAFFRGASSTERIVACLITPVIWNIKELIRVSEFFTLGETLYYGLNSVFLMSLFGAFSQMGLCELMCRWRLKRSGEEPVKVFSPAPVISILVGLVALYVILIWGVGVHFFYLYIEGYKAIFT